VKEKRLRVSEKIVVVVLLASFVYPDGNVRGSIGTNFGTSMRA
jgi:AMMECR1 domain-containing protein